MDHASSAVGGNITRRLAFTSFLLGLIPQGLAEAGIAASLPEMAREFGTDGEFIAQMMLGMSALGIVIGALVSGRVLEWAGARATYITSLLVLGVFGSGGLVLHTPALLFGSRFFVGLSASCIATATLWGISAAYSGNQRARIFGISGATGGVAILITIVLGGFLTQHYGWRMCYIQYPLFALLALPVAWGGVEHKRPEPARANGKSYFIGLIPVYLFVVVLYLCVGMASMQLPFLLDINGLSEAGGRGLVLGLPGLAAIVGASTFGVLQRRLGLQKVPPVMLALFCAGMLLLATASHLALIGTGALLCGLCMGLSGPCFYHTVSERTDLEVGGRYIGYLNAFTFFGVFANPFLFGTLKTNVGIHGLYLLGASVAAALFLLALLSATRKSQGAMPTPH